MPGIYRWLRWPLLLLAVTGLLFFAAWRLTQPDVLQWDDTVEYWAAGRLNARGQNPYAPEALHRLERQAGRPLEEPLMMWNPPWLLALAMPLGLLPYPAARVLWFLLHLAVVFFASLLIGKETGAPSPARQGLAILLGFSFGPTLHALKAGQITPLMLLAPLGFLACFRRQRWGMAGAMAALGLIKRVWQWEQHIPLLVLISATTAAYGWTFDLLVMLIALIPALIRLVEIRRHPAAVALLATYLAVDVISLFTSWEQIFYAWMAPSLPRRPGHLVGADPVAGPPRGLVPLATSARPSRCLLYTAVSVYLGSLFLPLLGTPLRLALPALIPVGVPFALIRCGVLQRDERGFPSHKDAKTQRVV